MAQNKTGKLIGAKTGKDSGSFPQYSQPELPSVGSNAGHNVHNLPIQAGEEFSVNYGHGGVAAGRVPASPDISRNRESRFGLNGENGHVRYEDLTNILGLRRMDSETSSEIGDFVSTKQPAHEMENGARVNISSKIQKGDGDRGHALRKAVCESIGDQPGIGSAVPVPHLHRKETSQSSGFLGSGILDDSLSGKMKFLCSFGGKILPRPGDGKLRYVGGYTHIISIRKDISWEELVKKTLGICSQPHTIKYQLPGEDLDSLISVSSDEDLQNMIEEYHGIENHEGSQKLRIFLVPLGESEETPSTDANTVEQNNPDYQYVVALNGIGEPSPRKNIAGQSLTNEASQSGTTFNFTPSFQRTPPDVSSPLDLRDGINTSNPDGVLNDSMYMRESFPISPTAVQVAGSGTGYVQFLGNNSCQGSVESSTSFFTAQLHPENSGISTADCRYPQQVAVSLINDRHHPGDIGQPTKLNGKYFDNYNSRKELMTPIYVNQSDGYSDEGFGESSLPKDRKFCSGNPISYLNDPICQQAESYGITDSPHGMPHAFSDSQLHESGARSGYCSQEGIGQSFSLNLEKAQLSSLLVSRGSQANLMEGQNDSVLHHPQVQRKVPKVGLAEQHRQQDLSSSSPYSESLGVNGPIHKDSIFTESRYLVSQNDLNGSSSVEKDIQEQSVKLGRMKIIEEKNPIPRKDTKVYELESTVIDTGAVTELHLLDSLPTSNLNAKINMQNNWELSSEERHPSSSGMMGLSLHSFGDKTPSNLLPISQKTGDGKNCALAEGLNGEQGNDFLLTGNFDLNAPILKCEEISCDKIAVRDHMFKLSIDPDSQTSAQIQPSLNEIAAGFHDTQTVNSESLYPAINLPVNGLDNPSKKFSFEKAPFADDLFTRTDKIDQFIHEHTASGQSKVDDIIPQSKNLERCQDANRVEPFLIIDDLTCLVPPFIESSSVGTPHILHEVGRDLSPSNTEAGSINPECESEVENTENRLEFMIISL